MKLVLTEMKHETQGSLGFPLFMPGWEGAVGLFMTKASSGSMARVS